MKPLNLHLKHKLDIVLAGASVILVIIFILIIMRSVGFLSNKIEDVVKPGSLLTSPEPTTFNFEILESSGIVKKL